MPRWLGSGSLVRGRLRRKRSYASGFFGRGAASVAIREPPRSGYRPLRRRCEICSRRPMRSFAARARGVPPDHAVRLGVDHLQGDAELVALGLVMARQHAGDPQLAPRGLGIDVAFGVFLRRRERPDGERRNVGEGRGDFVRQSRAQIVGLGVAREVSKGQHGEGGQAAGSSRRAGRRVIQTARPAATATRAPASRIQRGARRGPRRGAGGGGAAAVFPLRAEFRVALQALQVRLQLGRALVAQVPVLFEGRVDDALELRRKLRVELDRGDRRAVENRVEDDGRRARPRRLAARRHLVEHGAEGEEVGAGVERLAARLLGRHVRHGADGRAGARQVLSAIAVGSAVLPGTRRSDARRVLGEAEVEDLGLAALRDEDVRRLDVAVHDAARVRGLEGIGDLRRRDRAASRACSGPAAEPVPQRLALEQLHGDERLALVLADVVDRADVGVLERGGRAGLALQPLERLRVPAQLLRQELQRHAAAELQVLRLVDDAHAAAAELREDR